LITPPETSIVSGLVCRRRPYFLRKFTDTEYCNLYEALRLMPNATIRTPEHLVRLMSQVGPLLRIMCHHVVYWGNPRFKLPGNNTAEYRSFDWSVAMRETFFPAPASSGAQALRAHVESKLQLCREFICFIAEQIDGAKGWKVQLGREAVCDCFVGPTIVGVD
jgi:hypothetical protein